MGYSVAKNFEGTRADLPSNHNWKSAKNSQYFRGFYQIWSPIPTRCKPMVRLALSEFGIGYPMPSLPSNRHQLIPDLFVILKGNYHYSTGPNNNTLHNYLAMWLSLNGWIFPKMCLMMESFLFNKILKNWD